jgi:hypothetical protein
VGYGRRIADYHVLPRDDGQWEARQAGATIRSLHASQAEAERAAKEHAENTGGGEVSVHGRDGQIRDKSTIAKTVPYPPKG